jgi:hypothetical protein
MIIAPEPYTDTVDYPNTLIAITYAYTDIPQVRLYGAAISDCIGIAHESDVLNYMLQCVISSVNVTLSL